MKIESIRDDFYKKDGGVNSFLKSVGLNYDILKKEILLKKEEIVSYKYIYYDYDEKREIYSSNPRYMHNVQVLPYEKTALIVMDPWKDSPDETINKSVEKHVCDYLLPVIMHAIENGIRVVVFTNNPERIDYTTKVEDSIQELIDSNKIDLYYHDNYKVTKKFIEEMNEKNIKNLIYTGYSTHLCVLYRNTGIMGIYYSGQKNRPKMFIIPEATYAYVSEVEDINLHMRNDICTMVSQMGIADVITWDDFMKY